MSWTPVRMVATAAILGGVGAAAFIVVSRSLADEPVKFSPVEVGVQEFANQGLAQPVGKGVDGKGIEVVVVGILADERQTTVTLRLTSDAGGPVHTGGAVFLVDGDQQLQVTADSSDPQDRGTKTLVFGPVSAGARPLRLVVERLYAESTESGLGLAQVEGPWVVEFDFDGKVLPIAVTELAGAVLPFGEGSLVIERVIQAPSGTVFEGRLEGYSVDEIPRFQLRPTMEVGGEILDPIQLRGGYGDRRERFFFRFAPSEGPATLWVEPWIRPDLDETDTVNGNLIAGLTDAIAHLDVTLEPLVLP